MIHRLIFPLMAAFSLSGCLAGAVGAGEPADETFLLNTPAAVDDVSPASGVQLLVPEPTALDVFLSNKLVVRVNAREVQYLGNARLGANLTKLTQTKLRRSLEGTQGVRAVGIPGEGLAIDYQIITDIRAFEIRVGTPDRAYVSMTVKILNDRNGEVIASRVFEIEADVQTFSDETRNQAYVAALDAALDAALVDIRAWTAPRV